MHFLISKITYIVAAFSTTILLIIPKPAHFNPHNQQANPASNESTSSSNLSDLNYLIISGSATYLGMSVHYNIETLKTGGNITGTVGGLCSGTTQGNYSGGEGGSIKGKATAVCGVGIIKQNINIGYTGRLFPQKRVVQINWQGSIPQLGNHGSFSYNY